MDGMNMIHDTEDLFSKEEPSDLSLSELANSLAGRLEAGHIRNSLEPSTSRKSNARKGNSRKRRRKTNAVASTPPDRPQKQEPSHIDDSKYSPTVDPIKSNVSGSSLYETPRHTFVTPNLSEALESCLSALLHSTKGFRIPMILNDGGINTLIALDVYRLSPKTSLVADSVAKNLLGNDEYRPETPASVSGTTIMPLCQNLLIENRQALPTVAPEPDIEFMGQCHARDVKPREPHFHLPGRFSMSGRVPDSTFGGKPNLTEESIGSSSTSYEWHSPEFGTKRKDLEDDISLCSSRSSNTSEESDGSESEDDEVLMWVSSHGRAPVDSIMTDFIRGFESDITYSPCGDSPDNGHGTGDSKNHITPASSSSTPPRGSSLHRIGQPPSGATSGSSNQRNAPILVDKSAREDNLNPPQPLSLVCWYAAAGIACLSKHPKKDPKTRRLWNDHVCARKRPSHLLPETCRVCSRQFMTQKLLDKHYQNMISVGDVCKIYSTQDLAAMNSEPNRHGVSEKRKEVIENMRDQVEKAMKKSGGPPLVFDFNTMELLTKRVNSNVTGYINGSDTSEKTARSELWKWYLIFKQLQPDAEVPLNPFTSRKISVAPGDKARDNALFFYNYNVDQRFEGRFNDEDRKGFDLVLLDTLEMLRDRESQEDSGRNPRKRVRLSPPHSLEPGPPPASPAAAGTRLASPKPPAPLPTTVTGQSPIPGQGPIALDDPSLPVMEEQLWFNPGEDQQCPYELDEAYFLWEFPSSKE